MPVTLLRNSSGDNIFPFGAIVCHGQHALAPLEYVNFQIPYGPNWAKETIPTYKLRENC